MLLLKKLFNELLPSSDKGLVKERNRLDQLSKLP